MGEINAPGWYPLAGGRERFWDGKEWTTQERQAKESALSRRTLKSRWRSMSTRSLRLFHVANIALFVFVIVLGVFVHEQLGGLVFILAVLWLASSCSALAKSLDKIIIEQQTILKNPSTEIRPRGTFFTKLKVNFEVPNQKNTFHASGLTPRPLNYPISARDAEALCAKWLESFGEQDVQVTPHIGDGGVDITSNCVLAQVKNYSGSVGPAPIRELMGVAALDNRKRRAVFFTSGSYTKGAIDFANESGIQLYRYNAAEGTCNLVN